MWYVIKINVIEIRVFAKTNAIKSSVVSFTDSSMIIALNARAKDGESNKELIKFLSHHIGIPKSSIMLIHGDRCRYKKLSIPLNDVTKKFIHQ